MVDITIATSMNGNEGMCFTNEECVWLTSYSGH